MNEGLANYLKTRRTIPAAQLAEPGPDDATLREMLTIAARVPDHGKLAPWRFILFDRAAREKAVAGLDWISVGALTHSAPALDLSLILDSIP